MKWFVILFLFLILILFIPLKVKSKIIYNVLCNKGYISIYFYNFKFMVTTWKFVPFKILIKNKNKKDTKIYLYNKENDIDFKDIFLKNLIKRVKILNFRTIGRFGLLQDCFISSIGSGIFTIFSQLLNCFIYTKKDCNKLSNQFFTDFNKNNFIYCITTSIQFNLFIVLWCAFLSLIKKGELVRYYGK